MRGLFALLLTLPAILVLAAAPAQADPTCPEGNVCFWTGYGYTGVRHPIGAGELVPVDTCAPIDPDGNASVAFRSVKNRVPRSLIAPAWPVLNSRCHYEMVLRYGDDLPRLVPLGNRPDSVRYYLRLRSAVDG